MFKKILFYAFSIALEISSIGTVYAGTPSPPCPGCGGNPTTPKPFMVIQPQPLVNPTAPNALEYDGSYLWLTDSSGTRVQASVPPTGIVGTQLSSPLVLDQPVTFGNSVTGGTFSGGTLSGTVGTLGLGGGGGASISSGALSGTLVNNGTISGGGYVSPSLSGTITNSGTISGGTISGPTVSGAVTFSPSSVVGPYPGQEIYYNGSYTPQLGGTLYKLSIPAWATRVKIKLTGGGGGSTTSYNGGGGGYIYYNGLISHLLNGANIICIAVGDESDGDLNGNNSLIDNETGTSCTGNTASFFIIANGGTGASSTANGTQGYGRIQNTISATQFEGDIMYGNTNGDTQGLNPNQPAYVSYTSGLMIWASQCGIGGISGNNGMPGCAIVAYYP